MNKSDTDTEELIAELRQANIKHSEEKIIRIARNSDGKIVFLEEGNSQAGLQHIMEAHEADFIRRGYPPEEIPDVVMSAVTEGKVVGYQGRDTGRPIYEITFNGKTDYIAVTIGNNGFVVEANPATKL